MPILADPRQEAFCLNLVKGMGVTDAHEAAGYKRNSGNAARLKAEQRIQSRLTELQERAAEHAVLTRADILNGLASNARNAEKAGQFAASNQALQLYGKELGMFVDRRMNFDKTLDTLTEAEIRQLLNLTPEEVDKLVEDSRSGS